MADGELNSEVQNNAVKDETPVSTAVEHDSEASEADGERKDKTIESSWSAPILSFARKASETISSAGLRNPLSGSEAPNPDSSDSTKLGRTPVKTTHITIQLQQENA